MTSIKSRSNPFELVKASDFSDEQIDQYWVDLTGEARLHDLFQPLLRMPMLLLGGKGSGKTHLMRYYSSAVRRIHAGNNLFRAVETDGYLGIYVRADGLNVGRFANKGQSEEAWVAVFCYYFEIWLATQFLKNVAECMSDGLPFENETAFCADVIGLFSRSPFQQSASTVGDLIGAFTQIRRGLDHVVSNVATGRAQLEEVEICLAPGDLVFGMPEMLAKRNHHFNDKLHVYLIDEIENFTAAQQRFLNSLIRYRRGAVTFKIGCRLYGIRTKKTLDGAEEEIRQGAEYERVELDAWLRSHANAYRLQAIELIGRRLQSAGFGTNNVASEFEEVDTSDWYRVPARALVSKYDEKGEERPYFATLARALDPLMRKHDIQAVIEPLRVSDYPVLEKANVYVFAKEWTGPGEAKSLAAEINSQSRRFIEGGRRSSASYAEVLNHFKSDFFAQLYRECSGTKRVPYAGLDTLIQLSQGVPRNLLGVLKHIYRRAHFAGERPFDGGDPISVKSQSEGVLDASAWFWEDAQPDQHGQQVRVAVQTLAEFLAAIRFSVKPAECQLSTVTVGADVGSAAARQVLEHAENWSYLVRVQSGAVDRNDGVVLNEKFQLSPMLAPRWGVSEYRRGALALTPEIFNAIFDPSAVDDPVGTLRKRTANMRDPFRFTDPAVRQGSLI